MGKIVIRNRSDGKVLPVSESAPVLHIVPAKCIKTKEGLFVRIIRDATGWCWDSIFRDGRVQSTSPREHVKIIDSLLR